MAKNCLLIFVILVTFLFLIIFDQTQRFFVNTVLTAFAPPSVSISVKTSDQLFPEDFKFGASSSAYQVEGGWNEDGKSPSSWDLLVHKNPEKIKDGSNADVGPDSYHHFQDDIAALNLVGVTYSSQYFLKKLFYIHVVSSLSVLDIMGQNLAEWFSDQSKRHRLLSEDYR